MPTDTAPALQPVHGQPDDPPQPTGGIALCLSGGGYRAMLFHLGTLLRLNELHYLPRLSRISSVSGGSIASGVLAMNWARLGFDSNGLALNFDQQVMQPVRRMASQSIDVSSVLGGIFGGVSKEVASHYRQFLFHDATLQDLPDSPRFVFNATSLQTAVLWRFSKPFMGDYKVGLVMNPALDLATVVAASSAFPPLLSPAVLDLDPNSFSPSVPPAPGITSEFRKRVVLTDGGVYDNLGLETAWKQNRSVLVSDGGAGLAYEAEPAEDWLGQSYRVLNVIDNQVGALRKRAVIELYKNQVRDGAYWGIRTDIAHYNLPTALVCDHAFTLWLARTPTRLTAIDSELQNQLIDWGYAVCDAAMRAHVVPDAPAPQSSPFGTFKRAGAAGANP